MTREEAHIVLNMQRDGYDIDPAFIDAALLVLGDLTGVA